MSENSVSCRTFKPCDRSAFARLRNRIISSRSLAIATILETIHRFKIGIYLLKKYMESQDLILLVVLLCPGLLLSVTIMLTFAAGG